jgi:glycosyltransferase involved in cell wall biosynthesis
VVPGPASHLSVKRRSARVTVVIPAYNASDFLDRCLDSLEAQTFRDFEIVVVDDGSTDATAKIAQMRDGVHLIRQQNRGPGAARNEGCRDRESDFLAFIDADDTWAPTRLELLVAAADSDCETTFVTSNARVVDPSGVEIGLFYSEEFQFPPKERQLELIARHNFVFTSCLVRRSSFEEVGGFSTDEEFVGAEDYDLWLRMIAKGHFGACIDEPLCCYFDRPESLSHRDPAKSARVRLQVLSRRLPEFWDLGVDGTVRDNLAIAFRANGARHPVCATRHLLAARRSGGGIVRTILRTIRN